jgi:hypothetical protein
MCEHDSKDDIPRGSELSRRPFGTWGLSAALGAMPPTVAGAVEVSESSMGPGHDRTNPGE